MEKSFEQNKEVAEQLFINFADRMSDLETSVDLCEKELEAVKGINTYLENSSVDFLSSDNQDVFNLIRYRNLFNESEHAFLDKRLTEKYDECGELLERHISSKEDIHPHLGNPGFIKEMDDCMRELVQE